MNPLIRLGNRTRGSQIHRTFSGLFQVLLETPVFDQSAGRNTEIVFTVNK
jgi:hypothetical protein